MAMFGKKSIWFIGGIVILLFAVGLLLLQSQPPSTEFVSGIDEQDPSKFHSQYLDFQATIPTGMKVRESSERVAYNLWGPLQESPKPFYVGEIIDGLRVVFTNLILDDETDIRAYLETSVLVDPAVAKSGDGVGPVTETTVGGAQALTYPVKTSAGTAQVYLIKQAATRYLQIATAYTSPQGTQTDYANILTSILDSIKISK